MEKKVETLIVDWLKSENENATLLAHQICLLFDVSNSLPLDEIEKKIDLLFEDETEESLRKWLNDKRL